MVGMGFRRIALAQGLLDGPADRNVAARIADPADRKPFSPMPVQDRLCKETTPDGSGRLSVWLEATPGGTLR